MNKLESQEFARQVMDEHGLDSWSIKFDRAVNRLGQCNYSKKELSFSSQYIANGSQENILKTLLHEIAHALVGAGHGHNHVWADKCKEIGYANPVRCTPSNHQREYKYNFACNDCGTFGGTQRKLKYHISRYRCGKCNGTLNVVDSSTSIE